MRNVSYLLKRLSLAAAVLLLAVSCASVPKRAEMESSIQLLPSGSDVIITADIQRNRELIEPVLAMFEGLPANLADEFLARTENIWAGLDFTDAESGQAFKSSIVARGDYPKSAIEWGLCWDPLWKKTDYNPLPETGSNLPYWDDKAGGNQLSFPDKGYMLASAGEIEEMIDSWAGGGNSPVGDEWLSSEKGSDVTIMTRNLNPEDYAIFVPELKKVPMSSLIISMVREDNEYVISGRFRMDSAVNAFLFATLFRTIIVTSKDENGNRTFPEPRGIKIEKDGNDVVLENMRLSVTAVADIETSWIELAGMNNQESEK